MTGGVRRGLWWLGAFVALLGTVGAIVARGQVLQPGGYGPAPAFALPDLSGRMVTRASLGSGDLVLRFASVACADCASDWATLWRWQQAAGPGVRLVAIEVGQPADLVAVRLAGQDLRVPVLVDGNGAVAEAYGVTSLPAFAFIDRAGRLIEVAPVVTHGAIWPDSTWEWHLDRLLRVDAETGGGAGAAAGTGAGAAAAAAPAQPAGG